MNKLYALFFLLSFLLFLFSMLVVPADAIARIPFQGEQFVFPERNIVWVLALTALVFALLYLFTFKFLQSSRWGYMHFICFTFLCINIISYSFLQRYAMDKISELFTGSMAILLWMQLIYPINLLMGLFRRKSNF